MAAKNETVSINIGCGPLLLAFCLLLVLKVAGIVDWSWWIITAPIWFYPAAVCAFAAVVLAFVATVMLIALPFVIFDAVRK